MKVMKVMKVKNKYIMAYMTHAIRFRCLKCQKKSTSITRAPRLVEQYSAMVEEPDRVQDHQKPISRDVTRCYKPTCSLRQRSKAARSSTIWFYSQQIKNGIKGTSPDHFYSIPTAAKPALHHCAPDACSGLRGYPWRWHLLWESWNGHEVVVRLLRTIQYRLLCWLWCLCKRKIVTNQYNPHKLSPSRINQLTLAGACAMSCVTCLWSSKQEKGAAGMAL